MQSVPSVSQVSCVAKRAAQLFLHCWFGPGPIHTHSWLSQTTSGRESQLAAQKPSPP